jgi:hypothetical protein
VLRARAAYEWTLNHVIEARDPHEVFSAHIERIRTSCVELASTIRGKSAGEVISIADAF